MKPLKFIYLLLTEFFKVNMIIIVLLIAVVGAITYFSFIPPMQECADAECPVQECPELTCPPCEPDGCEECEECTEVECPEKKCPVVDDTVYYICPSGSIVNITDNCNQAPEPPLIGKTYMGEQDGVSFYIEDVKYRKENDWWTINELDFTVVNEGELPIIPRVYVRLYAGGIGDTGRSLTHKEFEFDGYLMPGEFAVRREGVDITFGDDTNKTLAMDLYDLSQDPDKGIMTVEFPIVAGMLLE